MKFQINVCVYIYNTISNKECKLWGLTRAKKTVRVCVDVLMMTHKESKHVDSIVATRDICFSRKKKLFSAACFKWWCLTVNTTGCDALRSVSIYCTLVCECPEGTQIIVILRNDASCWISLQAFHSYGTYSWQHHRYCHWQYLHLTTQRKDAT